MNASVKVSVFWGDILFDTVICEPSSSITVGTAPGCTFLLDLDKNSRFDSLEILRVNKDHTADLLFDEQIEGHVRYGNELLPLLTARTKNRAAKHANGLYHLPLSTRDKAELMIGHVSFFIDWVQEKTKVKRSSVFHWTNVLTTLAFLSIALPLGYLIYDSKVVFEEKPPERMVALLPRELARPRIVPPKPKEAAVGEKKTTDGGAQKGKAGKANLVAKQKAPTRKKVSRPSVVTNAPSSNPTSAANTLRNSNLGNLVQGLTNLDTGATGPAPKTGAPAAINQVGTGGFSTEGLRTGGGGKTVGIGRSVGKGLGGFEGTGKLGLSGSTQRSRATNYGKGAPGTITEGGLDKDVIDAIVRQRQERIRLCYERQLNYHPRLSGKITVHFVIGRVGNVLTSEVAEDTMKNEAVKKCLLSEVKSWTFPPHAGGASTSVNYPFVFESSARGVAGEP